MKSIKELLAEIESSVGLRHTRNGPEFDRLELTVEEINSRIDEHEKKLNKASVKPGNTLYKGESDDKH